MKVHDLGALTVESHGTTLEFGATKQASLLACLALSADKPVPAHVLMAVAWGDDADVSAPSLDSQLWRLRNLLEPARSRAQSSIIVRDGSGYRLAVAAEAVDSLRFERAADDIGRHGADTDPAVTLALTEEALALWRGSPFETVTASAYASAVIARFDELRAQLQERRIDAMLGLRRFATAISELEQLLLAFPFRERLWAQRMTARSARTGSRTRSPRTSSCADYSTMSSAWCQARRSRSCTDASCGETQP